MEILLHFVYFLTCLCLGISAVVDAPVKLPGTQKPNIRFDFRKKIFIASFFGFQMALWILVFTNPELSGYQTNLLHLVFFSLLISPWLESGNSLEGKFNFPLVPSQISFKALAFIASIAALNFLLVYFCPFVPGKTLPKTPSELEKPIVSLLFITGMVVSFAILEEIIWRHYALLKLAILFGKNFSDGTAIILSTLFTSVVFCLGHYGNAQPAWAKVLQIFVLSLCFSFTRIKWGTLHAVILHILVNLSAVGAVLLMH